MAERSASIAPLTNPERRPRAVLRGALPAETTEMVPLHRIDRVDRRFQLRVSERHQDLVESLKANGQQMPVLLWGVARPYKIIDGFRRIGALTRLRRESVLAIVRDDLDQTQAFALSFVANARRRNLSPEDRAHAIWQAVHEWGMAKSVVASAFGLSVRQIDRYLKTLQFAEPLREALRSGKINMAHASLLHRAEVESPDRWVQEISKGGLSAPELRERLREVPGARSRPTLLVREAEGFRLAPLRWRPGLPHVERRLIQEALEGALDILRQQAEPEPLHFEQARS